MPGRVLAALLAILATVALVACGDDSKSQADTFKEAFEPINAAIVNTGADLGEAIRGASNKTDDQIVSEFSNLANQVGDEIKSLEETDPPEDLKPTVDALVAALKKAQTNLTAISEGAKAKDLPKIRAATVALIKDSTAIRDNRRKLVKETGVTSPPPTGTTTGS